MQGVRSGPALDALCEGVRVEEREDHGDKEGSECSIEARGTDATSSTRTQGRTVSSTTGWAESSSRTRTAWSAPHHAQVVSERSRVVSTPQSHSTKAISGHHLKTLPNPTSWTS